jgi:hypothetical protein
MHFLYNLRHRRVCHQSVSERWWMHGQSQRLHVYMCGWLHRRYVRDRYDRTNIQKVFILIYAWQGLWPKQSCISVRGRSMYLNTPSMYLLIYLCISYIIADIDECAINPCQNGGECMDQVNDYMCTCAGGYTGDLCETGMTELLFLCSAWQELCPKQSVTFVNCRPLYLKSHYVCIY